MACGKCSLLKILALKNECNGSYDAICRLLSAQKDTEALELAMSLWEVEEGLKEVA